jgi:hypothetical protein
MRPHRPITPRRFSRIILAVCAPDTSADPSGWTKFNPLWGHCAVIALLAQDLFGGALLRKSLECVPGLEHIRSHYLNEFPDGKQWDFTYTQFAEGLPVDLPMEERPRQQLLANPDTKQRYEILRSRYLAIMSLGRIL